MVDIWSGNPKNEPTLQTVFSEPLSQCLDNGAERAIRNLKVKQKVPGGFRSYRGAEIFAILRSVVDTIIKKGGIPTG